MPVCESENAPGPKSNASEGRGVRDTQRMWAILACRENRVRRRRQLQQEYGLPAIQLTMNIPGAEKNSPFYEKAHLAGEQEFLRRCAAAGLRVEREEVRRGACGREALFLLTAEPVQLKRLCIQIEEQHSLGRIFDFDVYAGDGSVVDRGRLNLPPRPCFLCGEPARECARLRRHSAADLQSYLFSLIEPYFVQNRSSEDAGTA